jgi:hypothetical protein
VTLRLYLGFWREQGAANTNARKIIGKCTKAHEEDHKKHTSCFPCGFYRPKVLPWNVKDRECDGYTAEKSCLDASIGECNGDPVCEADVRAEKGDVENRIERFCGGKKKKK